MFVCDQRIVRCVVHRDRSHLADQSDLSQEHPPLPTRVPAKVSHENQVSSRHLTQLHLIN